MDVADLEHFLILVERGNFTSAAKDLGLSQPALSRQIQRLERAVGAPLFLRSRAGVQLAPAGERFRSYAEEGVALYRRLLNDLRGGETPLRGELRLAASTTPAEFLVPRLLAEFTAAYPGVRAIVFTANSQRVVEEVAEGRRDLGLVGARFPRRGLHFDPIAEDEVVLAVPPHHPLARLSEVPIDALAKQPFIEREDGSGTTLSVRRALAKQGMALPPYRVVMTLSTTQAIVSAVRAGYGMGFVSSLALGDAGADGPVAVRLVGVPLRRAIYLVRDARRLPPPAGQRFVDFIVERATAGAPVLSQ
jgi:DNA-binding transcriptional LysR family regulator